MIEHVHKSSAPHHRTVLVSTMHITALPHPQEATHARNAAGSSPYLPSHAGDTVALNRREEDEQLWVPWRPAGTRLRNTQPGRNSHHQNGHRYLNGARTSLAPNVTHNLHSGCTGNKPFWCPNAVHDFATITNVPRPRPSYHAPGSREPGH